MRQILADRLWIANGFEARDLRVLCDLEIQAVVDLAINEPPARLTREMIYCRFPILDGADNSADAIQAAVECLVSLVRRRYRTVVACSAGMSRSPALAAAAMALLTKAPLDACLAQIVTGFPHDISPPLWQTVRMVYERMQKP